MDVIGAWGRCQLQRCELMNDMIYVFDCGNLHGLYLFLWYIADHCYKKNLYIDVSILDWFFFGVV